jgi:hypothetical protein
MKMTQARSHPICGGNEGVVIKGSDKLKKKQEQNTLA